MAAPLVHNALDGHAGIGRNLDFVVARSGTSSTSAPTLAKLDVRIAIRLSMQGGAQRAWKEGRPCVLGNIAGRWRWGYS